MSRAKLSQLLSEHLSYSSSSSQPLSVASKRISDSLNESMAILFDHHGFIERETTRMIDLYDFINLNDRVNVENPLGYTYNEIPNTQLYIESRGNAFSDDYTFDLVDESTHGGLLASTAQLLKEASTMLGSLDKLSEDGQFDTKMQNISSDVKSLEDGASAIQASLIHRQEQREATKDRRLNEFRASLKVITDDIATRRATIDHNYDASLNALKQVLSAPILLPVLDLSMSTTIPDTLGSPHAATSTPPSSAAAVAAATTSPLSHSPPSSSAPTSGAASSITNQDLSLGRLLPFDDVDDGGIDNTNTDIDNTDIQLQ